MDAIAALLKAQNKALNRLRDSRNFASLDEDEDFEEAEAHGGSTPSEPASHAVSKPPEPAFHGGSKPPEPALRPKPKKKARVAVEQTEEENLSLEEKKQRAVKAALDELKSKEQQEDDDRAIYAATEKALRESSREGISGAAYKQLENQAAIDNNIKWRHRGPGILNKDEKPVAIYRGQPYRHGSQRYAKRGGKKLDWYRENRPWEWGKGKGKKGKGKGRGGRHGDAASSSLEGGESWDESWPGGESLAESWPEGGGSPSHGVSSSSHGAASSWDAAGDGSTQEWQLVNAYTCLNDIDKEI